MTCIIEDESGKVYRFELSRFWIRFLLPVAISLGVGWTLLPLYALYRNGGGISRPVSRDIKKLNRLRREKREFLDDLYGTMARIREWHSDNRGIDCRDLKDPPLNCGYSLAVAAEKYADLYRTELRFLPHHWPLETDFLTVTSDFGFRPTVNGPGMEFHGGVDLRALRRETVLAAGAGLVEEARLSNYGYGNYIRILHGDGFETRYAHMETLLVKAGSTVEAGQPIGVAGSSGKTTGPHLHYEVRKDGKPRNPVDFISFY